MKKKELKRRLREAERLEQMIKDLAYAKWTNNEDLPYVGVYVSCFGTHEIIPLTKKQIEDLKNVT